MESAGIAVIVGNLTAERDRLEKQLDLEREASAALRDVVAALDAELVAQGERVKALEAGLRPFAVVAAFIPGNWPERCPLTWVNRDPCEIIITYFGEDEQTTAPRISCYRRAAELLAPPAEVPVSPAR
jgi:hypothetical protein